MYFMAADIDHVISLMVIFSSPTLGITDLCNNDSRVGTLHTNSDAEITQSMLVCSVPTRESLLPVSYTHLTLPTKRIV